MMAHQHHTEEAEAPQGEGTFFTPSRVLIGLAIGAGVVGAGLMLAPHVLPALGVTSAELAEEASLMIHNNPSGIAGGINSALALIPGIGSRLAAGGIFTAIASGVIGVGGVLLGNYIENREEGAGLKWGSIIKYAAMITSALIALPTVLTAIGTGIIYSGMALSEAGTITTATSNSIIANVYKTIGSIGGTHEHELMGVSGIGAVIPHFIGCGVPLAPAALSVKFAKDKKARAQEDAMPAPLPEGDPNHSLPPVLQSMVDSYNKATATTKPILQKWFRDNGFTPDYHADGTMHLYKHAPAGLSR